MTNSSSRIRFCPSAHPDLSSCISGEAAPSELFLVRERGVFMHRRSRVWMDRLLPAVALLVSAVSAMAQRGASNGQWPHYHGDTGGTRYSPLDQITKENAGDLQIAWQWSSANFGPTPEYKNETTPIQIDGVLYFTAGLRRDVVAIDAGTAETLWTFRLDEGARGLAVPRRNSGRGVSYWTDGRGDERIFVV